MTPEERFHRIEQNIEKQNEGIRSLIVVARTCLDSFQEVRQSLQEVRESIEALREEARERDKATDYKLNALIDTVDRMIQHRNGREPKS
jgi:allophanate hydrolase subunit 1